MYMDFGPKTDAEALDFAVEGLIAEVQYCIQKVMKKRGVSRSELARRLGCSPARVTQMLSEDHNLTLESVGKIFFALGDSCRIESRFLSQDTQKQMRSVPEPRPGEMRPKVEWRRPNIANMERNIAPRQKRQSREADVVPNVTVLDDVRKIRPGSDFSSRDASARRSAGN